MCLSGWSRSIVEQFYEKKKDSVERASSDGERTRGSTLKKKWDKIVWVSLFFSQRGEPSLMSPANAESQCLSTSAPEARTHFSFFLFLAELSFLV